MTTFTITVVSTGSGNKYVIDGAQQANLNLVEGATYKFDQANASNNGHPLRFSTTSDGSHAGGSAYTAGVTVVGTPGNAGAYTEIQVAVGAPNLYYYCTVHSGMGGIATTEAVISGWNRGTWNQGLWGESIPFGISGVSAATAVGSPTIVFVTNATGVSAATAPGSPTYILDMVFTTSGVSAATALGSTEVDIIEVISGVSATTSVGSPVIWMTINTSQEPHFGAGDWSNISTTQTPSWTEIAA